MSFDRNKRPTARNGTLLFAITCIALFLGVQFASGRSSTVIGPVGDVPDPSCPIPAGIQKRDEAIPDQKRCVAFGHVTGFQIRTDDQRRVHVIPKDGKIYAWSVRISKPRSDPSNEDLANERAFFEEKLSDETFDRYGAAPTAAISILKKRGRGRFKLVKQSPVVDVSDALGSKPIYTLRKPLKVKKGSIVALTTPTWLTNFALAAPNGDRTLSEKNIWRASRKPDRCTTETDDEGNVDDRNLTSRSKPHVKKGSTKRYGCIYNKAQILYWAYFAPDQKKDKGGKDE